MKSDQKIKVELECTAGQLNLIQHALDIYSRLGSGQIEELENHCIRSSNGTGNLPCDG